MTAAADYQVPSNPEDRRAIKNALVEASNSLLREEAEKELRKETAKQIKEKYGMPPSMFNRLAKAYFKDDIEEKAGEVESLTDNYSLLFGSEK